MGTIKEKPESDYCYTLHLFRDSIQCPDLDDSISMAPKCKKYGKGLAWTISGQVKKCEECLKEENHGLRSKTR